MMDRRIIGIFRYQACMAVFAFMLVLYGCSESGHQDRKQLPVPITSGDECHVCGMIISRFPGPKGEAYSRNFGRPFRFCSTRDLFSWLLQPENRNAATTVYVHDMGTTEWMHPSDSVFIDAHTAWYVINHSMKGAMGPTLASFLHKRDAERFLAVRGGRIVRFQDITLEMLADLRTEKSGPAKER